MGHLSNIPIMLKKKSIHVNNLDNRNGWVLIIKQTRKSGIGDEFISPH